MPADWLTDSEWLTDEKEREQADAYVFDLLRQVGREPRRPALARIASSGMGERFKTFLQFEANSLHRRKGH